MLIAALGVIHAVADKPLSSRFKELPDVCRELLDTNHDLAQQLGSDARYERFFFLGGVRFMAWPARLC